MASAVGGNPEIVVPSETGLLVAFDPGDDAYGSLFGSATPKWARRRTHRSTSGCSAALPVPGSRHSEIDHPLLLPPGRERGTPD